MMYFGSCYQLDVEFNQLNCFLFKHFFNRRNSWLIKISDLLWEKYTQVATQAQEDGPTECRNMAAKYLKQNK
jgi:hypothetical protein